MLKCPYGGCERQYSKKHSLMKHLKFFYHSFYFGPLKLLLKCQFCSSSFDLQNATFEEYADHVSTQHPDDIEGVEEYFNSIVGIKASEVEMLLEEENVISFEDISTNSTSFAPLFRSLKEFFLHNSANGFFTFPSDKKIQCPAGCQSSFTTRLGYKYHMSTFKHSFKSLPGCDELELEGILGNFQQILHFPIYFENDSSEEYWKITFSHSPHAQQPTKQSVKRKREDEKLENIPLEVVYLPGEFDWYFERCEQTMTLIDEQEKESIELVFKTHSVQLSSNSSTECSGSQFLYFGTKFQISKLIWISSQFLCLVSTPKGVSLLEDSSEESFIFIYNTAEKKIILEFRFDFLIFDCSLVYWCKSDCILGIANGPEVVLFNFKLESKSEVFQRENIEFISTQTFQEDYQNCNNYKFQVDNLYNIGLFLDGRRAISLGYSAHSKLMSCGCTDGTLFVCDIGRWSSFQRPSLFLMNHHFGPIRSVSIIDRQIASIGHDGTLKIFSVDSCHLHYSSSSLLPGIFVQVTNDHCCIFSDNSHGLQMVNYNCKSSLPSTDSSVFRLESSSEKTGVTNTATCPNNLLENGIYFGTTVGNIHYVEHPDKRYHKYSKLFSWSQDSTTITCLTNDKTSSKSFLPSVPFVVNISTYESSLLSYSLSNGIVHITSIS